MARLGDFAQAATIAMQEIEDAESARFPIRFTSACNALGALHLFRGDTAAALPLLARGLDLCRTLEVELLLPWLAAATGLAYARSGRLTDGLSLLEEGVAKADSLRLYSSQALRVAWLGEAYLLAGGPKKAGEVARRALDLARHHEERGNEADALWLSGEIASCAGAQDLATAASAYRDALSLASALDMRPLVAHCHRGLGKLYRHTGEREQAHAHLTTATTMYREMDMRFWLEQAEAEMRELA